MSAALPDKVKFIIKIKLKGSSALVSPLCSCTPGHKQGLAVVLPCWSGVMKCLGHCGHLFTALHFFLSPCSPLCKVLHSGKLYQKSHCPRGRKQWQHESVAPSLQGHHLVGLPSQQRKLDTKWALMHANNFPALSPISCIKTRCQAISSILDLCN